MVEPVFLCVAQARIAKRDRKLVDYDSARHNYATTHKTKKKDGGIKITKVTQIHDVCYVDVSYRVDSVELITSPTPCVPSSRRPCWRGQLQAGLRGS